MVHIDGLSCRATVLESHPIPPTQQVFGRTLTTAVAGHGAEPAKLSLGELYLAWLGPDGEPVTSIPGRYDAVAECFEMRNIDNAERKINESASQVLQGKVIVRYTEFSIINHFPVVSAGKFICDLDESGIVRDNRQLCVAADSNYSSNHNDLLPQLLIKFPWAESLLREELDPNESMANIDVLGDLNEDALPELMNTNPGWCGAMNCSYPVYLIDVSSHTITDIGGSMGIDGRGSVLPTRRNGWKLMRKRWYSGDYCACYILEFDERQRTYLPTERYLMDQRRCPDEAG